MCVSIQCSLFLLIFILFYMYCNSNAYIFSELNSMYHPFISVTPVSYMENKSTIYDQNNMHVHKTKF